MKIVKVLFSIMMVGALLLTACGTSTGQTSSGGQPNNQQWVALGPMDGAGVNALVIDPNHPDTLYAENSTSIFKSVNGGNSWVQLNLDAKGESLSSLALSSDGKTLYACTNSSLFKSTDGGTDWATTNSGWPRKSVNSIMAHPVAPATIYAVGSFGVCKSTDAGETWNSSDPDSSEFVNAIAINPLNNQTIYAVTSEYNGEELGEVFESTDGGQSSGS